MLYTINIRIVHLTRNENSSIQNDQKKVRFMNVVLGAKLVFVGM